MGVKDTLLAVCGLPGGGGGGTEPTLAPKTISANGTYNASDDHADGYSSVTVDVAGGGLVLLASGTYTKADGDKASVSIPVSFSGTARQIFVYAPEPVSGASQTYKWVWSSDLVPEIANRYSYVLYRAATITYTNVEAAAFAAISLKDNGTTIKCDRTGTNFNVQDNTYNWYIWGEATP